MAVDIYTKIWMGGIIAFGVVFYLISMRYSKHCDPEDNK